MSLNSQESKQRANLNADLRSFESAHNGPPSASPNPKYNPQKAMKQAEREYLESKGVKHKNIFQKISGLFMHQ